MSHSAMIGAFIRAEKPLTIEDLMAEYSLSRSRVNAELEVMQLDGHVATSPFGTTWTLTDAGRDAWRSDED